MKLFLTHILIWSALFVCYFFVAEPLTVYLFPEIHSVELWVGVLGAGLILIFIIMLTSYLICFFRKRKKKS